MTACLHDISHGVHEDRIEVHPNEPIIIIPELTQELDFPESVRLALILARRHVDGAAQAVLLRVAPIEERRAEHEERPDAL